MSHPIRVVVLFGGRSAEHDVSCMSARHVLEAIDKDRYTIDAIGIDRDGGWHRSADAAAMLAGGEAPAALGAPGEPVDALPVLAEGPSSTTVVLPILHGPMGEDGTVQGLLELADVPYVGAGVLASALCMDKLAAKDMTARYGIPQCAYRGVAADKCDDATVDGLIESLGLPMFVKPANMGSSVGVSKATDRAELVAALNEAGRYDEWLVVEEAVTAREIELSVLGNQGAMEVSVPGEIVPGDDFYSYDDKYHDGVAEALIPAPLTTEQTAQVQQLAIDAAAALRVEGLSRVDFFFEEAGRGFLLNEINTMPGFTPISMYPKLWDASGLSYTALIDRLVALAIERHERRNAHRGVDHG